MEASAVVYCVNHPTVETLLRCYRCGRPVCTRCVRRTPVGLICKQCLNEQQSGFYNATPLDYALAAIVGLVLSTVGGVIAVALGGLWFLAIFYAPFAGGIIAEGIRLVIRKRRGRYLWLVAVAAVVIGALVSVGGLPLLTALSTGRAAFALRGFMNFGFLIYLVLASSTVYARLR